MNANSKMVEFDNVIVTIRGEEIALSELTYNEFSELMNSLEDDEIADVLDQIVQQAGEEAFLDFVVHLQQLAEEEAEAEGIELNVPKDAPRPQQAQQQKEPQRPTTKQQVEVLPPVKFVNVDDFYSYDPDLLVQGIDSVSEQVGRYLAFVNAGLTNEQAYELITVEAKREHELLMAEKQLELERIKVEAQLRGASVKQLLNR